MDNSNNLSSAKTVTGENSENINELADTAQVINTKSNSSNMEEINIINNGARVQSVRSIKRNYNE